MNIKPYTTIIRDGERNLELGGDTFRGVGWTKRKEYADLRYKIMLDGIKESFGRPLTLLDFGCGAAHLYEYVQSQHIEGIEYSGLDMSPMAIALCRRKHPHLTFHLLDLLEPTAVIPLYDFIVMNGVFTYRGELSFDDMRQYFQDLLSRVWPFARHGLAFNVTSKYLDWERDDLFHLAFDDIAGFLDTRISRHFAIRHDYGLFEYTVYAYRRSEADMLAE